MPEAAPKTSRSRDSVANTLLVAITLSLVCSILVASTAILLKPLQQRNEDRYRQQIILDVAGLYEADGDIDVLFEAIEAKVIDLATGQYNDAVSAADFDAIAAAKDSDLGIDIPAEHDNASIRRRARLSPVYLVRDEGRIDQVILPVYGPGLWSTMRGFLSLGPDGSTVRGLRFFEHAETPGLGDQIDKPDWREGWVNKKIFDNNAQQRIEVVRGFVDASSNSAIHQVDGISGATLTGRGVTNLVRYWTGPHGFGPYLERIRTEATDDD